MSIVEKMVRAACGSFCCPDGCAYIKNSRTPECDALTGNDGWVLRMRGALLAALTATGLTEAQLEGLANKTMVVVPVEPTEAMLLAGWYRLANGDDIEDRYRAMLAAKEG